MAFALNHYTTFMGQCASVPHSVMSKSLQPHGLQPARLLCPWDSPGKNAGRSCHWDIHIGAIFLKGRYHKDFITAWQQWLPLAGELRASGSKGESVTERVCEVQLLTTQKPINRSGWWKGRFALFQMLATGGRVDICPKADSWPRNQWGKSFYRQKEGLHAETAQLALTVIFKLIVGGLTSIILVILGIVNLQFQDPFVPISLKPVLRMWQLMSWVLSGHHPGVLVTIGQLTGCGSEYYLQPLRKN